MYYRLLFLFSVCLGILYDWISKYHLNVDSLLFLLIVYMIGLSFSVHHSIYYRIVKFLNIRIASDRFTIAGSASCLCAIAFLPIPAVTKLMIITFAGLIWLVLQKGIQINYMAMGRSVITVTGLCMIFECFAHSPLVQITSGYYAIPIGDFLFSTILSDSSGIFISVLGVVILILIVSKEFLINHFGFYFILSLLLIFLVFFMFVLSGVKQTKLRKINILFIASSILILFLYNSRPMAIIGSVLLSLADIFLQRFSSKDINSENISFFLGCFISAFVGLVLKYRSIEWWRWLCIGTEQFPVNISLVQCNWFLVVGLINICIQLILTVCFSNKSLIKFIPLRYLDLCIVNLIDGNLLLSLTSLLLSSLFAYFL